MRKLPLETRREILRDMMANLPPSATPIALSEIIDARPADLVRVVKEFGFEGIVAKRKDCSCRLSSSSKRRRFLAGVLAHQATRSREIGICSICVITINVPERGQNYREIGPFSSGSSASS